MAAIGREAAVRPSKRLLCGLLRMRVSMPGWDFTAARPA